MPEQTSTHASAESDDTGAGVDPERTQGRLMRRLVLLLVIPGAAITIGVLFYLHAGRYESTDNAYVKSHIANVAPEVAGRIVAVQVEENQRVEAGEVLFVIDDVPFRLALAEAQAHLAQTETDIEADRRAYFAALSQISLHQATVAYNESQLARQQKLIDRDLGRQEDLDTARYDLENAQRQVEVAQRNAQALLAKLNGDPEAPMQQHPAWRSAQLGVDKAELDLDRTQLKAPFTGVVAKRPEQGTYVFPFAPVVALIAENEIWVEANFKETQLTHMHSGQQVELTVDAYPGAKWQGRIESISQSTGAEFAMLPPQNASGNWVKIVQRVPVRVTVEPQHTDLMLRAGMSCEVSVDTGHERQWQDLFSG